MDFLHRGLSAGVVDGVVGVVGPGEEELRHRHQVVAVLQQGLNNAGQGFRGVEGGIVEEDNGPGLDLGGHPLGDFVRRQLLPVQAVTIPNRFKQLRYKLREQHRASVYREEYKNGSIALMLILCLII